MPLVHMIELMHQHWPFSAPLDQVSSSHSLPEDHDASPQFCASSSMIIRA